MKGVEKHLNSVHNAQAGIEKEGRARQSHARPTWRPTLTSLPRPKANEVASDGGGFSHRTNRHFGILRAERASGTTGSTGLAAWRSQVPAKQGLPWRAGLSEASQTQGFARSCFRSETRTADLSAEPKKTRFPTADEIKEKAFRAMHKVSRVKMPRHSRTRLKAINRLKAKAFGEEIESSLNALSKQFRKIDEMNPFYLDLISAITDINMVKQGLSFLRASSRLVKKIRYISVKRIYNAKSDSETNAALNQFIGRSCSVLKKLEKNLGKLKKESKRLDELPSIDFEVPTVVFAGYPNVGKTTMLNRLCASKAKVAAYAFTTKQINSGFMEMRYQRVQVLDTPGLLDREKRNEIERKAIAALKHLAKVIVFVADPTIHSGYGLEEQARLYRQVKEEFTGRKIIVALNKSELATPQEIEAAEKEFGEAILEGNGPQGGALKKALETALFPK